MHFRRHCDTCSEIMSTKYINTSVLQRMSCEQYCYFLQALNGMFREFTQTIFQNHTSSKYKIYALLDRFENIY